MLLQFITDSGTGPNNRRAIRSHVMKGKNAGKPRPSRKPLIHRCAQLPKGSLKRAPEHDEPDEPDEHELLFHEHKITLDRLLWNELAIASFPEQVSPETTKFIYHSMCLTNLDVTLY